MTKAIDEADLAALRAKARPIAGAAVAQRRVAEKAATARPVPANDGRRLRATGRTVQLNVAVRPDVRDHLAAVAAARGSTLAALIEEAILALKMGDDE